MIHEQPNYYYTSILVDRQLDKITARMYYYLHKNTAIIRENVSRPPHTHLILYALSIVNNAQMSLYASHYILLICV